MRGRDSLDPGPVHHKNVQPAVVVVIEESDAATRFLEDVLFPLDPAKDVDRRRKTGVFRDICEREAGDCCVDYRRIFDLCTTVIFEFPGVRAAREAGRRRAVSS